MLRVLSVSAVLLAAWSFIHQLHAQPTTPAPISLDQLWMCQSTASGAAPAVSFSQPSFVPEQGTRTVQVTKSRTETRQRSTLVNGREVVQDYTVTVPYTESQEQTFTVYRLHQEKKTIAAKSLTAWTLAGRRLTEAELMQRLQRPMQVFALSPDMAAGVDQGRDIEIDPYYRSMLNPDALIVYSAIFASSNQQVPMPREGASLSGNSASGLAPPPSTVPDLSGSYACKGIGTGGNTYAGTVEISRKGEAYQVKWNIDESNGEETHEVYHGHGVVQGSVLAVSYQGDYLGVIAYRVEPSRKLVGVYSPAGGSGSGALWSEFLTPRGRNQAAPPPRSASPKADAAQAVKWMQPVLTQFNISVKPRLVPVPLVRGMPNYVFFVIPGSKDIIAVGPQGQVDTTLGNSRGGPVTRLLQEVFTVNSEREAERYALTHLLLIRSAIQPDIKFDKPGQPVVTKTSAGGYHVRAEMPVVSTPNPNDERKAFVVDLQFNSSGKLDRPPSWYNFVR